MEVTIEMDKIGYIPYYTPRVTYQPLVVPPHLFGPVPKTKKEIKAFYENHPKKK